MTRELLGLSYVQRNRERAVRGQSGFRTTTSARRAFAVAHSGVHHSSEHFTEHSYDASGDSRTSLLKDAPT